MYRGITAKPIKLSHCSGSSAQYLSMTQNARFVVLRLVRTEVVLDYLGARELNILLICRFVE